MAALNSPTTIRQASQLFTEIATLASLIDRACYFVPLGEGNEDQHEVAMDQLREHVRKIGWLADLGLAKLEGNVRGAVKGGAEAWLLAPTYAQIEVTQ